MTVRNKKRKENLSEKEIDHIIVQQADNDSEWEEPICVSKAKPASLTISATLAARAAFLARVHRAAGLEEWLTRVIRERIELEESAFGEAKHEMFSRGRG